MAWGRGLLRLWIACSTLWVLTLTIASQPWAHITTLNDQPSWYEDAPILVPAPADRTEQGEPWLKYQQDRAVERARARIALVQYGQWVAAPPSAALVLGLLFLWVLRGFRPKGTAT